MDRQVVVGVAIVDDGRVLAALRPGAEGGWEFPGGKVEPGESDQAAAVREIEEELGVRITVGQPLEGEQPIGDKYVLRVYLAELAGHDWSPTLREHAEIRWVHAADLRTLNWLPADQPFLATLRDRLVAAE
ncbi:DNA mismatch repair protein MutT [Kribbella sp. ALI-6-A]|uniref:(deoxy)nucleoside triphosphate pyrophosphohydrolase n=1 Tax=Kribbella sp. ALI-6-A TaxID=1933817 RepID=UPI00097C0DD6|nr:(deoxy)nucleoside triphosphate pyrophosphohydrolase [Kribbella sp. ALI-6-A]ONI71862.1 DNA mismatch repair protein MutT [Kribbella sp. ALI-6-A]